MRAFDVLRDKGGVARFAVLQAAGVSRAEFNRAIAANEIVRIGRGVIALPQARRDVCSAVLANGYLSHTSAALAWGLDVTRKPDKPHVLVASDLPAPDECHAHRTPRDQLRRYTTEDPWPMTTIERTLVDCARSLPFADALALIDSALRYGRIDREGVMRLAADVRGPGAPHARRALQAADGRSDSVAESLARAAALEAGLPPPELQFQIRFSDGGLALADLAWRYYKGREVKVAVEHDGYGPHSTEEAFVRDRYRWNEFESLGWALLILTYRDVTVRYEATRARIRQLLERRWLAVGGT